MECVTNLILEASFHTTSKNNSSYTVTINEKCLCIVKTNGSGMKSKIISINDVIGSRCTRRRRRINEKCECHPNSTNVFTFLDNGVDSADVSAYLHIYTYLLKDFKITSGQKRERFEITLRFRLYARYEDNLKEAFKWKRIVKQLISKAQCRSLLSRCLKAVPSEYDDHPSECSSFACVYFFKYILYISSYASICSDLPISNLIFENYSTIVSMRVIEVIE